MGKYDELVVRLNERLGSVETPMMQGDNLATLLCSFFENPDQEPDDDDGGWTADALVGYNEVLDAIRAHYAPLATAIATLEAELAAARNKHQATVVAAATHLKRAMNAEAELAEAKAEIERLADNGCHLEMLLAAMKARGDRLAEFAVHKRECLIVKVWWQAGNCQCGLTQALTGWRDNHHGGNDADT